MARALAGMPLEFMDGTLTMSKSISWVLLLGFVGCSQSEPAPQVAQVTPPSVAAPVPAPAQNAVVGPKQISPEEAVTLAQELVHKQDFNAASQLLNQAIQANPQLVDAFTTRASIFADAKLYTRAIRDMDAAIQLQPENAKFHNTRGYFYLLLQDNGPAMEDFNQAIALDPNYAQPLNNRGLVRISLGGFHKQTGELDKSDSEFRKAVKEFDAALRIDNKYVDAHNNRGFALSLEKQFDEAIASFARAIELNATYVNAWNNRGQAQALAGRYDLAAADFTKAIELHPGTMEYYQQRAEAYTAVGQADLARKDLDHIQWSYELDALNRQLNAEPKNAQNWVARGHHLAQVSRWDEATQNYNDALKLDQNCSEAQLGQASVLFHQGKFEGALAACNTILNASENREAASLRGDILNLQGQYDAAIADYKIAQRFDSQVAQAYLKRSEQRTAGGEIQQASADMVQAVRMDPSLRANAPNVPEDDAPTSVAPGAFPVEAVEATPIEPDPIEPSAVEPSAVETSPTTVEPAAP